MATSTPRQNFIGGAMRSLTWYQPRTTGARERAMARARAMMPWPPKRRLFFDAPLGIVKRRVLTGWSSAHTSPAGVRLRGMIKLTKRIGGRFREY
jgi:hypothetical protein